MRHTLKLCDMAYITLHVYTTATWSTAMLTTDNTGGQKYRTVLRGICDYCSTFQSRTTMESLLTRPIKLITVFKIQ